jgi:uncharacterized protein YjiS (DUF1127 family)
LQALHEKNSGKVEKRCFAGNRFVALLIRLPCNGPQEPNAAWSQKMPNIMVQEWSGPSSQDPGGYALHQQNASSSVLIGWFKIARLWIARSEQRRTLGELIEQNERMLRDIGVSRNAAQHETAKPFWQR